MKSQSTFLVRTLSVCFFSALIACAAVAQPQRYRVTAIGHLPDTFATVPLAMNNRGEVVGWCQGPQAQLRPFRYIPGVGITQIPLPPGYTEGFAMDITDNGIIVGRASRGINTPAVLWRFQNGLHTIMTPPESTCPPIANAVNTSGTVVGLSCSLGAFYYSDATGLIALNQFGIVSAVDINDAGVVTGRATSGPAFRWSQGAPLELIGIFASDDFAEGLAINETGQVSGRSVDARSGADPYRAFRFTDGAGFESIDSTVVFSSAGVGINEQGQIAGNHGSSSSPERSSWLWTPQRGLEILSADFVGDPNFFGFEGAADINDRGQIALRGAQFTPFDPAPGILLTPICSPDYNVDGTLDFFDYLDFVEVFASNLATADFNFDGTIDLFDYLDFVDAFSAGC